MMVWLNVGSLVLGIIACILPTVSIMRYKRHKQSNWTFQSFLSVSACAISLCLQIFYNRYLVQIEDWSALMDIVDSVSLVSVVLLVITLGLNVVAFKVNHNRAAH